MIVKYQSDNPELNTTVSINDKDVLFDDIEKIDVTTNESQRSIVLVLKNQLSYTPKKFLICVRTRRTGYLGHSYHYIAFNRVSVSNMGTTESTQSSYIKNPYTDEVVISIVEYPRSIEFTSGNVTEEHRSMIFEGTLPNDGVVVDYKVLCYERDMYYSPGTY